MRALRARVGAPLLHVSYHGLFGGLFTISKKNSGHFGWEFPVVKRKNGTCCRAALDWILVTTRKWYETQETCKW